MELAEKNKLVSETAKLIINDIYDIYQEKFAEYDMQETEEMLNDIISYITKHYEL